MFPILTAACMEDALGFIAAGDKVSRLIRTSSVYALVQFITSGVINYFSTICRALKTAFFIQLPS